MLFHRTTVRLTAAVLCAAMLGITASADDGGEHLKGVCVTDIPSEGTVLLGSRVIRSGDVLTAEQVRNLTFSHPETQEDVRAMLSYLPIGSEGLGAETELVFSIRGKKNEPPTTEDAQVETYKNLPSEGLLPASDPEGEAMTFTLTRQPRRGQVILRDDGSFLYTPKKNKVGTDSFAFTATDPAGNVSAEATVTIHILKPTDEKQYADTVSTDCRFEAEWLRSTGIFSGETVNGQFCFSPDEAVSRGQFLAMLMQVLEMPVDRSVRETGFLDESPDWLKPYLAAALRSGIITGYPAQGGAEFRAAGTVSADEAALMVQRAMDFAVPTAAMEESALPLGMDPLSRADAAKLLYRISRLRSGTGFLGLFQ